MSEDEWLTCPDPEPMLKFLLWGGASERRLRLYAVACARRAPGVFPTAQESDLLDVALLLSDGRAPARDVSHTRARCQSGPAVALLGPAPQAADEVGLAAARGRGGVASLGFARERAAQADLLREVFGNPVRPASIDPAWLRWGGGLVPGLALGIYEDRTFQRVGYLADALEDAGAYGEILEHLRGPGFHVRGCWALDACAGR